MNFIPYYVYMYICCTVEINSTTTTLSVSCDQPCVSRVFSHAYLSRVFSYAYLSLCVQSCVSVSVCSVMRICLCDQSCVSVSVDAGGPHVPEE